MNEDTEPLVQFQAYYGSAAQKSLESESGYVQLREAFYAGYRARPQEPIAPSRDALEFTERPLARYASRFPRKPQAGFYPGRFPSYPVVDAPYSEPEVRLATSGILQQPITDMPRRDPDKAARMREAYGIQPVAGPDPETLERIHDQLKRDGVVNYPSDDTRDFPVVGLEHTETVWDGDTTMQFGARGPVPTALSLQEGENEAS